MACGDKIDCGGCACTKNKIRNFIVILSLCIAMFCGSYTGSYVFSFLPEMILWLGYDEVQKATYSGVIASLYYFGMGITGYMWGRLSDRFGRRWILVISLLLNGIVCLIIGFSVHVAMAIIFRFLNGAVDCVYVIINCTVAEQFPMEYQPTAQVVLHIALSLGSTIGPGISGYLSSPIEKYPDRFPNEGFFKDFPFFLPGVVGLGINVIGAGLVTVFYPQMTLSTYDKLEGTVEKSTELKDADVKNCESKNDITVNDDPSNDSYQDKTLSITYEKETQIDEDIISQNNDNETTKISKKKKTSYGTDQEQIIDRKVGKDNRGLCEKIRKSDFVQLFQFKEAVVLILTFSLLLYSIIGHAEIFTVWCSTSTELGGLGLRSDSIGLILAVSIIPAYFLTFISFVHLQKKLGNTMTFQIYGVIFMAFTTAIPCCRFIMDPEIQWGIVLLCKIIMQMSANCCFTILSFLINNSVPPERLGGINGVSMLMSSIPMAISPNIAGAIFRGSIQYGFESSLDSSLVFVIFGITVWMCCIMIYVRPRRQKKKCSTSKDTQKEIEMSAVSKVEQ